MRKSTVFHYSEVQNVNLQKGQIKKGSTTVVNEGASTFLWFFFCLLEAQARRWQ